MFITHLLATLAPSEWPLYFPSFPNFPTEIQVKIWKAAIPGPRLIEFYPKNIKKVTPDSAGKEANYLCCVSAAHQPPDLLHVCAQAREVALKFYTLSFENELRFPIYFDVHRDLIMFKNTFAASIFFSASQNKQEMSCGPLERIVIDTSNALTNSDQMILRHNFEYYALHDHVMRGTPQVGAVCGSIREIVVLEPPRAPLVNAAVNAGVTNAPSVRDKVLEYLQILHNSRRPKEWESPTVTALGLNELMGEMKEKQIRLGGWYEDLFSDDVPCYISHWVGRTYL